MAPTCSCCAEGKCPNARVQTRWGARLCRQAKVTTGRGPGPNLLRAQSAYMQSATALLRYVKMFVSASRHSSAESGWSLCARRGDLLAARNHHPSALGFHRQDAQQPVTLHLTTLRAGRACVHPRRAIPIGLEPDGFTHIQHTQTLTRMIWRRSLSDTPRALTRSPYCAALPTRNYCHGDRRGRSKKSLTAAHCPYSIFGLCRLYHISLNVACLPRK